MRPIVTDYATFVPEFLNRIWAGAERVRIAVLQPGGVMHNQTLSPCEAITELRGSQQTPNLYFAAAALTGNGYGQQDCVLTRAICVDVDYGKTGHAKASRYRTLEAAWTVLMTAPMQPTAIWWTGHGLQAVYCLDQPYRFRPAPDPEVNLAAYQQVSRVLGQMVGSDATHTPEHLFRVPLSQNHKPNTEPVTGTVLWWDPAIRYAFTDLQATCDQYGVPPDKPSRQTVSAPDPTSTAYRYKSLPEDLRQEIEFESDDRSTAMFGLVARMVRDHYDDQAIMDAIAHGTAFCDKYQNRLNAEVMRCCAKIRATPHCYADIPDPLEPRNQSTSIRSSDCDPLPGSISAMLDRYADLKGIRPAPSVSSAARAHEHLLAAHRSGVIETPCGYGKSTWALCHIAVTASPAQPYWYVVDTIEALYEAAQTIERLSPGLSVGRYHGFNQERCQALCGQTYGWRQCGADPNSVCRTCDHSTECCFHNRDQQVTRPVVVMCHNGFVRLLESEAVEPLLSRARIIIDEDLTAYRSASFRLDDLLLAKRYATPLDLDMGALLPYTRFALDGTSHATPEPNLTFASLHYVYRSATQMAALDPLVTGLRMALRTGRVGLRTSTAEHERASQVLFELVNFFRPTIRGDAAYAYREIVGTDSTRYELQKSRFDLGAQPIGQKLWILNASAQLSLSRYPDTIPVYRCADLRPNGYRVGLHVLAGNPMQAKEERHVETASQIIRLICRERTHKAALLATDRTDRHSEPLANAILASFGPDTKVIRMSRGQIRGRNTAGDCTFACLAAMSLFSTLDNIALLATLMVGRTVPVTPHVLNKHDRPAMSGGRFQWKMLREVFALSALDELYQTLWRTAVRNDREVEAIVVMPDAEWISLLWRTVMPGFHVYAVHKADERGFRLDLAMSGLAYLMGVEPGREFEKQDIAKLLGYKGQNAWKDNAERIGRLLDSFFEPGSTNRMLRRRADPGDETGDETVQA